MRFGFCAPIEHARTLTELGYDYIEPPVVATVTPLDSSDASLLSAAASLSDVEIVPEAFNVFLPGTVKIVGPEADRSRQEDYLISALSRVQSLGGETIVFGSAGARSIPDGFDEETARQQIVGFLKLAGPLAQAHEITIVLEPLNRGECNFINSVAEGLEIVHAVDHPNIAVLSDLYHVSQEGQSYTETQDAGTLLKHVHVAGSQNRRIPTSDDIEFLMEYFTVLKEIGYDRRISVEGVSSDLPSEAEVALRVLKDAWTKA